MPRCIRLIGRQSRDYINNKMLLHNCLEELVKNHIMETGITRGSFIATKEKLSKVHVENIGLIGKEDFTISYYTEKVNDIWEIKIIHKEGIFRDAKGFWVRYYSLCPDDNDEKCELNWNRNIVNWFVGMSSNNCNTKIDKLLCNHN